MAVFRNVMAFLGLDDDDQMYDDEEYYEDEVAERRPTRSRTIALDERLAEVETPSFGFSSDSEMNEMGGVGAVRPLRPAPEHEPSLPDSLAGPDRRVAVPDTAGAFESGHLDLTDAAAVEAPVVESAPEVAAPQEPEVDSAPPRSDRPLAAVPDPRPAERHEQVSPANHHAAPTVRSLSQPPVQESESNVVTHAKPRLHIPSSFDDASRIADDFRANSPVVMNLSSVDKPVARRLVDFASGVCYVLTGRMERVAPSVYLLLPAGYDVSPDDRRRMQERGYDR